MLLFIGYWAFLLLSLAQDILGYNFPFEATQLTDADVSGQPDLLFGNTTAPNNSTAVCKTFPDDAAWPSADKWAAFNASLGGALVRTMPAGMVCYSGPNYNAAKCQAIKPIYRSSNFIYNDPAAVLQTWAEGNLCNPMTAKANVTCSQGGMPMYAVNATTVKQIQLAVNFARNNNIRLVIKDTGHDFLGRSTGAGALGIWTHQLKSIEYLPQFTLGDYEGQAARLSAGLQAWSLYGAMDQYNITIVSPITNTVGYGGFMQGGGHSHFTSYYGTAADQVLSIQVVTADGRFVTADYQTNTDLFFAIRGGGAGNWGVVTSTIVKAYPTTLHSQSTLGFASGWFSNISADTFWEGIRLYHQFVPQIVDANGMGSNYINRGFGNGSFTFQVTLWMPEMQPAEHDSFTAPLLRQLKAIGITVQAANASLVTDYGKRFMKPPGGLGGLAGGSLISSRLFPRDNFDDPVLLNATVKAIRTTTEAGFGFHSLNYAPTEEVAGYPDNAVNTALRNTACHATTFDNKRTDGNPADIKANYDSFRKVFQAWRDASPTAGCYMNEASVMEPDFQWAFYGENYPRLQQIKQSRDPWGVFYATTAVGSENWEVRAPGGLASQDGKLCKLAQASSTWADPSGGELAKKKQNHKGKQNGTRPRLVRKTG